MPPEALEQQKELEMIPLLAVFQQQDKWPIKSLNPMWMVRQEAVKMYYAIRAAKDTELVEIYGQFSADPYVQKCWSMAFDYSTRADIENIVARLQQNWQSRKKGALLQQIAMGTDPRSILDAIANLRALYMGAQQEIYVPDYDNPSPPVKFSFQIGDTICYPACEVFAVKGKQKAGKSTFLKMLVAAAIAPSGECNGIRRVNNFEDKATEMGPPMNVLYFDTEQSKRTADKFLRHIVAMAGLPKENPRNLRVVSTRCVSLPETRLTIFEDECARGNYDLVILDGVRDLCNDINDPKESSALISSMTRLAETYKIPIIMVLHENPGKEDKMRGWLGTEAQNKAFMVVQLSRDEKYDIYNISTADCREKRPPTIAYRWNENNEIEPCTPTSGVMAVDGQSQSQNAEEKSIKDWLVFTMPWDKDGWQKSYTKEQLIQRHLELGTLKEGTVKNRIKEYEAARKIEYEEKPINADKPDGKKQRRYYLPTTERDRLSSHYYQDVLAPPILPANSDIWLKNDDLPF